nr:MAG TPA: hypothetical protein [Caudoviricetes sp.]
MPTKGGTCHIVVPDVTGCPFVLWRNNGSWTHSDRQLMKYYIRLNSYLLYQACA